jgi:hypothetical protein
MSDLIRHGSSPTPDRPRSLLRREYSLGGVVALGVSVTFLAPDVDEVSAEPAQIRSRDSLRRPEGHRWDGAEGRALGRWEWEGGRTE